MQYKYRESRTLIVDIVVLTNEVITNLGALHFFSLGHLLCTPWDLSCGKFRRSTLLILGSTLQA